MCYEHLSKAGPSATFYRMLKKKAKQSEIASESLSLVYDERS